jgi:hypothetical protein
LISLVGRIEFPRRRLRLYLRSATLLLRRLLRRGASRLRRVLITTTEGRKFPVGLLLLLLLSLWPALLIRLLLCGIASGLRWIAAWRRSNSHGGLLFLWST